MLKTEFDQVETKWTSDVAIIGAGISGLYCAWRLLEADPTVTVTLVERLDRTGGRLDSDIIEVTPGEFVREEEGGMRFNFGMTELMTLNAALGLCDEIVQFPMGTPDNPNRFALRGHSFTLQDAADSDQMIWSQIYNLKSEEIGLSPTDLVTTAYRNVLYANGLDYKPGISPDDWTKFRETCTWKGKTMNDWQMWGLLRDMGYSEECIQMLSETIGFTGPFKSMANAGDAFQILADFPKDPQYFTFERGFATLPNAIAKRLEHDHSNRVRIVLSANVDQITRDGDGGFELEITKAEQRVNARPVMLGKSSAKTLCARQVVMAVASQGAQDLFNRSPALRDTPESEKLWDALYASLGMKLMKINLYFTRPWWHDTMTGRDAVGFGPNFSNLPINAVYPFYALPKDNAESVSELPEIRDDAPAALTIYCDFDNTNFWHGLQNVGDMFTSDLQTRENDKTPQVLYPASELVVAEARKQMAQLFGTNNVPEPVLTSYRLWDGQEDFEFAYHQWRLSVKDSETRAYLSNPLDGVYVCNEAFSDMHGWVNGSLRSANLALAKIGQVMFGQGIEPLANKACPQPATKAKDSSAARVTGLWGG
ncbi:flavin monoamine oxidase family protein [Pelagimonas varians]|uniref:Protoporphyrinogen oxidase n=1 Tax=Pelagimonas varians TaxID=696760 RepID=A0A238JP26_9RHOB|nr:FAD-dependent oxidoreductase [Pelagimonas varians]PYG34792.1 phytoene dehydrogenase-like protein [Pelagimonas varians]SMX32401.1 protoporphyrinogen oxidase [Pelagimonas varians]